MRVLRIKAFITFARANDEVRNIILAEMPK